MEPESQRSNNNLPQKDASPNFFTDKDHQIAVYTALCILRRMKRQLGLGAMHEYLDCYLKEIDINNPKLGFAVHKALSYLSMEKMYKDAIGGNKK